MKIGVIGCAGKMGQELAKEIISNTLCHFMGGIVRSSSAFYKRDISEVIGGNDLGIILDDDLEALSSICEVLIDFTNPQTLQEVLFYAEKNDNILISGTTGLSDNDQQKLSQYAQKIPIVWSSNMSMGINLICSLLPRIVQSLYDDFDIEIIEMHHRNKVDSPSGTALFMGEIIAKQQGKELKDIAVFERSNTRSERKSGTIGFSSIRGGKIFGNHEVMFAGDSEVVSLSHQVFNRNIFAKGAIRAALWAKNKPAGLYNMQDVLNLR